MKLGLIDFPSALISALRDHRLVVFAGAGVSIREPACLPDFKTLAKQIAQGTGESPGEHEPDDRFLGRLKTDKRIQVHELAAQQLKARSPRATELHRDLLRLFPSPTRPRIVTTNFDLLFEQAATDGAAVSKLEVFKAPALPLGRKFDGIVHVHGSLDRPETMVLTDADFGRAYLTEGWARRFLLDLFQSFTVLFVGYSHGDIVMHYLARALPAGDTQRFVLTDETDDLRWRRLGIVPIPFPKSDYGTLYTGVGELANYMSRRILDWQHEIREIAKSGPPTGDHELATLAEAFSDPALTRFFTASAKDPDWIAWLDRRDHLINLFRGRAELTERELELARWVAKGFACDCPDEVWRAIGRHGMNIHPELWRELAYSVGLPNSNIPNSDTLSRWVSVLLVAAPRVAPEHTLQFLADRCIERGAMDSLIAIFELVATATLRFSRFSTGLYGDSDGETVPTIHVEMDAASDDYRHTAAHIWTKGLRPALEEVAGRLIEYVVANLEAQHRTLSMWGTVSRDWDPLSRSRFAIESGDRAPHGRSPEIGDVLIDAARDSLEWFAKSKPSEAARWCDRLAAAQAPILRRLAIHGVIACDLEPDEMIDWMLRHSSQYDHMARHERIRALKIAYPRAGEDRRRAVINDVLSYQWPRTQDKESEELTVSHHFSRLEWLSEACPDCSLLQEALDYLRQQYPGFLHREFPDADHRTWLDDAIPLFPWKPTELVACPAKDWTDDLLTYQPSDPIQPDRRRLLDSVTRASAANIDWGMALAEDLFQRGNWDADLWSAILRSWSTTKLDSRQGRRALQVLGCKALHKAHAHPIANVLQAMVRNTDLPDCDELIKSADTVAEDLWESVDEQEIPEDCDDWLINAWNHPAGVLTQFWIDSLEYWNSRKDQRSGHMEKYKTRFLEEVIRGHSAVGRLGRCVLASRLSILLAIDESWTKENLLPLIYGYPYCSSTVDHLAVWDGLLRGAINPPVAQILKVPLLDAVERMANEPAGNVRRKSFVECYTIMLTFFAGDPVRSWVPGLFSWANERERIIFTSSVHERLENMNEAQQADIWQRWLRLYWQNRVHGKPDGLQPREAWHMLRWLPLLRKVFPDAVDLATHVTPNDIDPEPQRNIVFTLGQSNLPVDYPESVAKLLIYLGKCIRYAEKHQWYKGKELVDRLLQSDLGEDLTTELNELAARRGLQ